MPIIQQKSAKSNKGVSSLEIESSQWRQMTFNISKQLTATKLQFNFGPKTPMVSEMKN